MTRKSLSRRDFLKGSLFVGSSLAAGSLLEACAPAATSVAPTSVPATPTTAAELAPAELTFLLAALPDEAKFRQKIVDAFVAKYPQIKINVDLTTAPEYLTKLQAEVAGGVAPDIIMGFELNYAPLVEQGVFADLGPLMQADSAFTSSVLPDMNATLLDTFKYKGKQWVLPEQFAGIMLVYNRKMFDEAGVPHPPADWRDTSWNWDRFLEAAKALTKKDASGNITQYGFAEMWWPPMNASVWAINNGGNWFDQYVGPTKSTITDPKMVEGLQFYADLALTQGVAPTADVLQTQAGPDMFMAGKVAMGSVGHWMYPAFSGVSDLEFDVAPLPVGPGGTTAKSDIGTVGLGISAQSKHPEQAWAFLAFACGPEGQRITAESGLAIPVLASVGKSDAFLSAHQRIQNPQVYIDAMANSVSLPITPKWNEIADVWARELGEVLNGTQTAAEAAAKLEPQINAILGAG